MYGDIPIFDEIYNPAPPEYAGPEIWDEQWGGGGWGAPIPQPQPGDVDYTAPGSRESWWDKVTRIIGGATRVVSSLPNITIRGRQGQYVGGIETRPVPIGESIVSNPGTVTVLVFGALALFAFLLLRK